MNDKMTQTGTYSLSRHELLLTEGGSYIITDEETEELRFTSITVRLEHQDGTSSEVSLEDLVERYKATGA